MGYFSNGEEGLRYEAKYCAHCMHEPDHEKLIDCPVLMLHSLWNYDIDDKTKQLTLEALIPRSKDGLDNEQCRMFVKRAQRQ